MTPAHPFYVVWTGALNCGDTPGVFGDAAFVGLVVQLPVTVTFVPGGAVTGSCTTRPTKAASPNTPGVSPQLRDRKSVV